MRKLASAILAVPILAIIYLPLLARRGVAARIGLAATAGIVILVAALSFSRPVATTAAAPAPPITALAADAFRSIGAATDLDAPVTIRFSEPMDAASVAASLQITPANTVELAWDASRTVLTVRPSSHWAAGAYHTISIAPGALGSGGRPMSATVRAAFVTRAATAGRVTATSAAGAATSVTTSFRIAFDRAVGAAEVEAALRTAPSIQGKLVAAAPKAGEVSAFSFTPSTPLAPGTHYRVALDGVADRDGASASVAPLEIVTATAPRVVRARPADGTKKIERTSVLSVRFSEAMAHATTRAAFHVTANGRPVAGKVTFAEDSTVLVFRPSKALPAGAKIRVTVSSSATSTHRVSLGRPWVATVTTAPAPPKPAAPAPRARASGGSTTAKTTKPPSSGGAVGGGSWGAVESYYLRLMNCTRTGGWVTSSGSCSSPGGRSVAPLRLDSGISSRVSRPYAKKLAVGGMCTHFSGGNPGDRLRAAGYSSYIWAENLGCRSGNPYSAVLGSHLYFQSEKSYNGGHYVNLMNAKYDRVGIGVWVSGGRVRVVIDFYHPR